MDAETRRTLAAAILSTLVRVSFVFLALREHARENGASAQKINEKTRERKDENKERGGGKAEEGGGGEEEEKREKRKKIKSFLLL